MPTHAALLRGINVGGRNRVAMADLRRVVEALGHTDVATYVASGNVVFTSDRTDHGALARELERAVADELGVAPAVVVLSDGEVAQAVENNPFPDPEDPRHVHVVFRADDPTEDDVAAVAEAQRVASDADSQDEAVFVAGTLYLHTPDGFGRSRLAELLNRGPVLADATARNLRTVRRLQAMLDG